MTYYSWPIALITFVTMSPQIIVSRISVRQLMANGQLVQKAKATMSNSATEAFSNIRTVKSFAEERGHIERYEKASWDVFEHGRSKAYYFSFAFISATFLGGCSTIAIILILSNFYSELDMTAGKAVAILMY